MNFNQIEVALLEAVEQPYATQQLRELNDLQLAYVGGGIGNPIIA